MIEVSWPPRCLWPNGRAHWSAVHRARRTQRKEAALLAMAAKVTAPAEGPIPVRITAHPSCARNRDRDGMLAALKGALDGIADTLGVDDSRFVPAPVEWGETRKTPRVRISIGEADE